ncbi:MAG TPA: BolA family transcriptional regulator [Candidatus Dadabacteria bacterium]|jgi:acid stress-induced BolA-like protein IbaG/YrbA|nr:BolA family transcriptional regulator [Candidatus Dadabacteria bacterium]
MDEKYIKDKLEASIPETTAEVSGDGTHFDAVIVSSAFEGKSTLERHKMVYSVLEDDMVEDIHALSVKTFSPRESNRR